MDIYSKGERDRYSKKKVIIDKKKKKKKLWPQTINKTYHDGWSSNNKAS